MPTIEQIRAARALLDWSQSDLAEQAGLSQTGIARIENGTNKPNTSTLLKIESAFEKADIEFLGNSGVRKRTNEIRHLHGQYGFDAFLDDVHDTVRRFGGLVCVSNVNERNWDKYLINNDSRYLNKMSDLKKEIDFNFKIIVCEGDNYKLASDYAEYRTIKSDLFGSVPFYTYGDKLAIILFKDDFSVYIIQNFDIADAQRKQFLSLWESAAKI